MEYACFGLIFPPNIEHAILTLMPGYFIDENSARGKTVTQIFAQSSFNRYEIESKSLET